MIAALAQGCPLAWLTVGGVLLVMGMALAVVLRVAALPERRRGDAG